MVIPSQRVPGILNVSFRASKARACCSGCPSWRSRPARPATPTAMSPRTCCVRSGARRELAQSSLRFSLGRFTREADIELAVAAVRPRGAAAAGRGAVTARSSRSDSAQPQMRALFAELAHAGDAAAAGALRRRAASRGEAGTREQGTLGALSAANRAGRRSCGKCATGPMAAPTRWRPASGWRASSAGARSGRARATAWRGRSDWARRCEVPAGPKLGRLLVIEDAPRSAALAATSAAKPIAVGPSLTIDDR